MQPHQQVLHQVQLQVQPHLQQQHKLLKQQLN